MMFHVRKVIFFELCAMAGAGMRPVAAAAAAVLSSVRRVIMVPPFVSAQNGFWQLRNFGRHGDMHIRMTAHQRSRNGGSDRTMQQLAHDRALPGSIEMKTNLARSQDFLHAHGDGG